MNEFYQQHDLLFFPSYYDSGGNVLYEASYNMLPVAVLDTGAANYLFLKNKKNQSVSILQSRSEIIDKFEKNISLIIKNRKLRYSLQKKNKTNLSNHLIYKKIKKIYNF
jgi:glycosyltransferase involved in cell wall biosynthesis